MLGSLAEGVVFAVLVMLAMLVPAGLLWATMRTYDLVMDHRDRQRRRRVRRAIAEADTMSLAEWARRAEQGGGEQNGNARRIRPHRPRRGEDGTSYAVLSGSDD